MERAHSRFLLPKVKSSTCFISKDDTFTISKQMFVSINTSSSVDRFSAKWSDQLIFPDLELIKLKGCKKGFLDGFLHELGVFVIGKKNNL